MPGSLNWRTKHGRKMFTRCGLGAACWLRDGFDLGKRRGRSSTPAVVPGAAPALAKAGVGGYGIIMYDPLAKYHQIPSNTLRRPNIAMETHGKAQILGYPHY